MKLSDLSAFSIKRKIRNAIWWSEEQIARCSEDVQRFKNELLKHESGPKLEAGALKQLRTFVEAMERNLEEMRIVHARFVSEQKKPSPGFPKGISV
jgi:hypothetical protein